MFVKENQIEKKNCNVFSLLNWINIEDGFIKKGLGNKLVNLFVDLDLTRKLNQYLTVPF